LTTFRVYNDNPNTIDSDGDGILDIDDSYPEDPEAAFELFTPSKYGTGTIAFEDLWPSNGDYDFNDMALNYKAIAVLNSENLAVRVDFICNVKSNFAGFTNGVGIEINGLSPSQIQNISGTIYTENYINLNPNGTEANQDRAVVILTDNADNLLSERTISIKFNEPINTNELGAAPFNPFIIANKIREHEIHLPYQNTTLLGNNLIESSGTNKDTDGNYISESGFPWAISIIHDFKVPKESIAINQAYNFFNDWANSGGNNHKDWYKDNPGNRNNDKIVNDN
jgi:LruC domain-containing protein